MKNQMSKFLSVCALLAGLLLVQSAMMPQPVRAEGEIPPTEVPAGTETIQPPATEEPVVTDTNVAETVVSMADAGAVLVDENGSPIPLATEAGLDALTDPDPFIVRGGTTYGFTAADCDPVLAGAQPCANPIQAAIDFSLAGEVINVEPGTYQAQIFINKDITLQGTAPGVVIQSPATLANCFTTSANNLAIVCVTGSNNVTISDVTVDGLGLGNANYRFDGIGYFNAGGTIQGNNVTNIMNTPFSGTQSGVGIYVYNADGTPRTINILDNVVTDYQKGGIVANGTGLTANIDGNTTTGQGPTGVIAQNGIQIGFGATGSVTNNDVSGNDYTGAGWSSAGVLLYDTTGTVTVAGNDIADNQIGVSLVGPDTGPLTPSLANITGNTFTNNDWGINVSSYYLPGDANATITGNTFSGNTSGIYTDNPESFISGNSFTGNTTALEYDSYWSQGPLPADGNYWGCPGGPGTTGCDTYSGNVVFETYLPLDPFAVPPATGGMPTQGTQGTGTTYRVTLPATSGQQVNISCEVPVTLVILPSGHQVEFKGLCGYQVVIDEIPASGLPGSLPDGKNYTAGLKISLFKGGNLVDVLPAGTSLNISYLLGEGQTNSAFSLLHWNNNAWVTIPSLTNAPSQTPLDPQVNDGHLVLHGFWTTPDGFVDTELNFTGFIVLTTP